LVYGPKWASIDLRRNEGKAHLLPQPTRGATWMRRFGFAFPSRWRVGGNFGGNRFVWLISHQPAVLFSQNKSATSNQTAVLFSQKKSSQVTGHQPNEQVASRSKSKQKNLCFSLSQSRAPRLLKSNPHSQIPSPPTPRRPREMAPPRTRFTSLRHAVQGLLSSPAAAAREPSASPASAWKTRRLWCP
jgi:hypothetical protein